MTADRDRLTHAIEVWLAATDVHEDSDAVLQRVVTEVEDTPQRRSTWWSLSSIGSALAGAGVGVAGTVLVVVIGGQLLSGPSPGSGAIPSTPVARSAPPAPATRSPAPTPSRVRLGCGHLVGSAVEASPSADMRGLIGLPAEDATPSTPEHGELVDCWPVAGGGLPYRGMVRLYADGRVIWNYYGSRGTTGHIEQKLTPSGVALVMAEDDIGARDPLRLGDWLPSSAWEDRTMKAYVPSAYGVCLFVDGDQDTGPRLTLDQKLAMWPTEIAGILSGRALVPRHENVYGDDAHCLHLPLADARRLDAELNRLGFDQREDVNGALLQYHADIDGSASATRMIEIWFEPVFPDGSIGCSYCG